MRLILPFFLLTAQSAAADPSHLTGLSGHDHWIAGAAIGAAVLAGLWGALKGKGTDAEPAQASEEEAA